MIAKINVLVGKLEDKVNFSECRTKTAMVDVNIHAYIPYKILQEKFSELKDMHFQTRKNAKNAHKISNKDQS